MNSIKMIVSLPKEKIDTIIQLGSDILKSQSCPVREGGSLVSCSLGEEYRALSYKQLETEKITASKKHTEGLLKLKCSFQSYRAFIAVTRPDITCGQKKRWQNVKPISHGNPDFTLTTDASFKG